MATCMNIICTNKTTGAAKLCDEHRDSKAGSPPVPEPTSDKDPAAVSLGKRGGLKGGPARAKKLSAKQRKEIASMGGKAKATVFRLGTGEVVDIGDIPQQVRSGPEASSAHRGCKKSTAGILRCLEHGVVIR